MADAKQIARVGDQGEGICYAHESPTPFTTIFYTGSEIIDINGVPVCIVGTLGHTSCGHTTRATTGSGISASTEGALHRVGDVGVVVEDERGTYVCTTGSSIVDSL